MTTLKTIVIASLGASLAIGVVGWCYSKHQTNQKHLQQLVATWELISGGPRGTSLEFYDDGRLRLTTRSRNKTETRDGTYRLNGNQLEMTALVPKWSTLDWKDFDKNAPELSETGHPTQEPTPAEPTETFEQVVTTVTSLTNKELIVQEPWGGKKAYARKR
jgi:uncharacterized protein (TIGR03066 family)